MRPCLPACPRPTSFAGAGCYPAGQARRRTARYASGVTEQGSRPKKRKGGVGVTIGGIVAGIEQQIFKTTPPVDELVQKGAPIRPVAAAGGGTLRIAMPGDDEEADAAMPHRLQLSAAGVEAVVDLSLG